MPPQSRRECFPTGPFVKLVVPEELNARRRLPASPNVVTIAGRACACQPGTIQEYLHAGSVPNADCAAHARMRTGYD